MVQNYSYSFLEIVKLTPHWQDGLQEFFFDLKIVGDDKFFSPHPTDRDSISSIATVSGMDMYYLLIDQEKVLGYGLLRGWDEGYKIPSLGLAIHPSLRGKGFGRMLMDFLHILASHRGADKVRLRVHAGNEKALKLYKALGYTFAVDDMQQGFLIGFKNLER